CFARSRSAMATALIRPTVSARRARSLKSSAASLVLNERGIFLASGTFVCVSSFPSPREAVGRGIESRSRDASAHPSYVKQREGRMEIHSHFEIRHSRRHERAKAKNAGGGPCLFVFAKLRKRLGGETPTDARLFCRALRARPRLKSVRRT